MTLSESPPSRSPNENVGVLPPLGLEFPHSLRPLSLHAVPTTPVDPSRAPVGCFPVGAAFPVLRAGRRPRLHFRGLLRLHSRYGLQSCSATRSGLCHKAPARPVTEPSRLSATRLTDNYLGGTFTHQ